MYSSRWRKPLKIVTSLTSARLSWWAHVGHRLFPHEVVWGTKAPAAAGLIRSDTEAVHPSQPAGQQQRENGFQSRDRRSFRCWAHSRGQVKLERPRFSQNDEGLKVWPKQTQAPGHVWRLKRWNQITAKWCCWLAFQRKAAVSCEWFLQSKGALRWVRVKGHRQKRFCNFFGLSSQIYHKLFYKLV